jgi:hypothetical protein
MEAQGTLQVLDGTAWPSFPNPCASMRALNEACHSAARRRKSGSAAIPARLAGVGHTAGVPADVSPRPGEGSSLQSVSGDGRWRWRLWVLSRCTS